MKNFILYLLPFVFLLTYCDKGSDDQSNWTEADQAYYEHILDLQNQGTDNFYTWLQTMDSLDAVNELHQFFLSDTSVASATVGSQGIAVDYKNGMRGGIMLNPKDSPDEAEMTNYGSERAWKTPEGYKAIVNNSKMIFLNAHYFQRSSWTDAAIENSTDYVKRIAYELNPVYKDDEVTLDRYCQLSGYGIIRIHAHGMAWPNDANVVETYLMSGEAANNATSKKYGDDLKAKNVIVLNVKNSNSELVPSPIYLVSKDFITAHNDFSKDTVFFYGGFCYSFLGTWPLIEESFAKGTYLGFNWAVRTTFCYNHGDFSLDYLTDTSVSVPKTSGQYMGEPDPPKQYTKTENGVLITVKLLYSGDPDLTLWTKTAVTTNAVTDIDTVSATCGGKVTASASTVIEARGICWSTNANPTVNDDMTTNGSGTGSFTSELKDLTPGTPYYVRAYASIKNGQTIYGNEVSFTTSGSGGGGTPCPGMPEFTDGRDGTTYPTVQIGSQCWLKKNMTVEVSDHSWCYENDPGNCETYGRLYDYQGALEACPGGWHLPSDAEWMELINYLGGEAVAGRKLKETGYEHWGMPNPNTNESGFTALGTGSSWLATGWRYYDNITEVTAYFSTTSYDNDNNWGIGLEYTANYVSHYKINKNNGNPVRCLKD